MTDRYLIINADDFGICMETNQAIETLFHAGVITSTTVMAPGRYAQDAVQRASQSDGIHMGLHLVLTSDFTHDPLSSLGPKEQVASLLDEDGHFHTHNCDFYKNAAPHAVSIEIHAQYDRITSWGYTPDHMDCHRGNVYGLDGPSFLKEAFSLCAKYHLPFRLPRSDRFLLRMFQGHIPPDIAKAHHRSIIAAHEYGVPLIDDMVTNPYSIKDIPGYTHLKKFYLHAIRDTTEGVTELFLHPSHDNDAFHRTTGEWQKRIWEYRFLLDDEFIDTIEKEGIILVSWQDAPFH